MKCGDYVSISYFILEKGIIERDDLSIYEKMCCVVLAKWAAEEREGFDTLTLAREMSCSERKAAETIQRLKDKGFIQSEGGSTQQTAPTRVIKAEHVEGLKPVAFEPEMPPLTREQLMEKVQEIIEETINDSEARIILNFANDDLEKIKRCYKIAKNMQISDTVEALIIELQRKEKQPATLETVNQVEVMEKKSIIESLPPMEAPAETPVETPTEASKVTDPVEMSESVQPLTPSVEVETEPVRKEYVEEERPWYLDEEDDLDDVIKPPSTQINANMINKMKAYKRYGK